MNWDSCLAIGKIDLVELLNGSFVVSIDLLIVKNGWFDCFAY